MNERINGAIKVLENFIKGDGEFSLESASEVLFLIKYQQELMLVYTRAITKLVEEKVSMENDR